MSTLIVYFSAESGRTRKVAKALMDETGGDVFEIKPVEPYTEADLKWVNPVARCNREKLGKKDVPVEGRISKFEEYDTVFIGFPIWYGSAPNVVNTFCGGYDWSGKKVVIFATSGGSGIGKTEERLKPYIKGAQIVGAGVIKNREDMEALIKAV